MFMTTFHSIQTRRNVIREDLKLCKERRERRHLQNDRYIYIYVTIHGKRGLLANFSKNEIIAPVHSSDLLAPIFVHFCCHSNITNQIYII